MTRRVRQDWATESSPLRLKRTNCHAHTPRSRTSTMSVAATTGRTSTRPTCVVVGFSMIDFESFIRSFVRSRAERIDSVSFRARRCFSRPEPRAKEKGWHTKARLPAYLWEGPRLTRNARSAANGGDDDRAAPPPLSLAPRRPNRRGARRSPAARRARGSAARAHRRRLSTGTRPPPYPPLTPLLPRLGALLCSRQGRGPLL